MDKARIIRAIVDGIQKANDTYENWSGGNWLEESGAENLMTATVAGTLAQSALNLKRGDYLLLETLFRIIIEKSDAPPLQGRPPSVLRGNPRADLTLWSKNDRPTVVVEMKRCYVRSTCQRDLKRLATLISCYGKRRSGSLRYGALGVFTSACNKKALKKKYQTIKTLCRSVLPSDISYTVNLVPTKQFGADDLVCGGVVITLS